MGPEAEKADATDHFVGGQESSSLRRARIIAR
jgi:hypothetical protein